ncbi:MAG: flagellar hook capping FlgD N-terminal domain-containing protein [Melioribacter sp.]|uniref:flagellar hook assembly protein FlgD n=1 Tax=Rosettibacter primus TaxID=3111523 RepID=UPI00247C661E|nr:flagellar hook capping FlgD N-terminal domain-containing protein [Melioribacter sp.]
MVSGVNNNSNTTTVSSNKSVLGKDDFLKLMIAQLKNQDPLNPMDGTEYAAQLAQFSSLEQITNLNSYLKQSIDANYMLTQSINNTMLANLIGKEVKVNSKEIQVNGQENISIGYDLPEGVKSVKVNIYNQYGTLIKSIEASNRKGSNKLLWDLTDNNGEKVINGDYKFEVIASDYKDNGVNVTSYVLGLIDGIKYTENGTLLIINGAQYSAGDILEIINKKGGDN